MSMSVICGKGQGFHMRLHLHLRLTQSKITSKWF